MSYPSSYQPPNQPPYHPQQYQQPGYPVEPIPPPYPAEIYDPPAQPQLVIVDGRRKKFSAPQSSFWSAWAMVGWLTAFSILLSMILSVAWFVWFVQQAEKAEQKAERDKQDAIRMVDRMFEKIGGQ